jgi:hypothetical protein
MKKPKSVKKRHNRLIRKWKRKILLSKKQISRIYESNLKSLGKYEKAKKYH